MVEKIKYSELMSKLRDPKVNEKSLRPYFRVEEDRSHAFAPAIGLQVNILSLRSLWHDVFGGGIVAQGLPYLRSMSHLSACNAQAGQKP